jgi:hypothetical protein
MASSGGASPLFPLLTQASIRAPAGPDRKNCYGKQKNNKLAGDGAASGRLLLYVEFDPKAKYDVPLDGERKPAAFLRTEFNEGFGAFAPDGNWVALRQTSPAGSKSTWSRIRQPA